MANSADVSAGDDILASQYNNLRKDVLDTETGHDHSADGEDKGYPVPPVGTILIYGKATPPAGYLKCDGSVVSQTTYARLYAVIGTTFNTGGEGAGNFRLPDLQGRFPLGYNDTYGLGTYGGSFTPPGVSRHSHELAGVLKRAIDEVTLHPAGGGSEEYTFIIKGSGTAITEETGVEVASCQNPYCAVNFIIKY